MNGSAPAGTPADEDAGAAAGPGASWRDLYDGATARLGSTREARWMVEEASGEPLGRATASTSVAGDGGPRPNEKSRLRLAQMVERRLAGEPLQYVLGSWAFRTLELMVDRRVLIPRPETEQVVETALAELDRLAVAAAQEAADSGDGRARRLTVVDLGTGSGAIALSIAVERTGIDVWATDVSAQALDVARANVAGHAVPAVRLVQGDWWQALPPELKEQVDLVVSNPPYISSAEMDDLGAEVREWEPRSALEAGRKGTEDVEAILAGAGAGAAATGAAAATPAGTGWLRPGGTAVIEIAPHQAGYLQQAALAAGFAAAHVAPDLAGRPRALVARGARMGRGAPMATDEPGEEAIG